MNEKLKIFVTRRIPLAGITMLKEKGYGVVMSEKDGVLTKEELKSALLVEPYDAVLCLLTDTIDAEVFAAAPQARVFANYAVGYNNIDLHAAKEKNIIITNTPGVLTETVAEYTLAMIMALTKRIVEADGYVRAGKFKGWEPESFLGIDLRGKTLGILGAGRIGSQVAERAYRGLGMDIIYYDVKANSALEASTNAIFHDTVEGVLKAADVVSVHVPLLDSTKHLINKERLAMMKPSAYLVNTSRGLVVDEAALVTALQEGTIKGAAIDVFENEPALAPGLTALPNVIVTPHIASATEGTRSKMSEIAAANIIAVLEGQTPPNLVTI